MLKRLLHFIVGLTALAAVNVSAVAGTASATINGPRQTPGVHQLFYRGPSTSANWSGYATTGKVFTDVAGSWTQPAVSCPSRQTQAASFWVGLDGYNSSTVEQIGTDSDCSSGKPQYYAWYEVYPAASATLSSSSYPVSPGDTLTASVAASNHAYTLTLSDRSARNNWSFSTTKRDSSATNSSAEWIVEAPSSCAASCHVLPLSNFGSVHFSGSSTTGDGLTSSISAFPNSSITMISRAGTKEASPTALSNGGTSFSVTYIPPATTSWARHYRWNHF